MGAGWRGLEAHVSRATKPELVDLIHHMEGKRAPEIAKIAADRGNIVERARPCRPEVKPAE